MTDQAMTERVEAIEQEQERQAEMLTRLARAMENVSTVLLAAVNGEGGPPTSDTS